MTEIVGGLRARLIQDSLFDTINTALDELGWYDTARQHRPVRLIATPQKWDQEVAPNTLGMSFEFNETEEWEVGSNLTYDATSVRFDLYAENDSIGTDLSNDLKDLLRGRLSAGPTRPSFKIYDYRQATPTQIGYAIIDDVHIEHPAVMSERPWERNWFQIRCTVRDAYTGDYAT